MHNDPFHFPAIQIDVKNSKYSRTVSSDSIITREEGANLI